MPDEDQRHRTGSSPRLRGTDGCGEKHIRLLRFIPAPAGNSSKSYGQAPAHPVHPRACGEQFQVDTTQDASYGSSPRLRGTVRRSRRRPPSARFIPAPAGNSAAPARRSGCAAVHPRACGEQAIPCAPAQLVAGSSPRLRGTGFHGPRAICILRFIPAPAGNSSRSAPSRLEDSVHPRACGEQQYRAWLKCHKTGSSPRLRGTACAVVFHISRVRFIPAPAGNSADIDGKTVVVSVHPRACGEQWREPRTMLLPAGSSPRLRGTGQRQITRRVWGRFIPAPAGNRRSIMPL